MDFTARVFGPGQPAGGVTLPVHVGGGQLTVTLADGRRYGVPLLRVTLRRGGFNELTWHLEWHEPQGAWSVAVADSGVQQRFLAHPPAGLESPLGLLQRLGRRGVVRRRIGWGVLVGWLLAPLLLLTVLVWHADAITGWLAEQVPRDREQRLGELIFAQQQPRPDLIENTAANRAVETIGQRLTAGSRYRYRWLVVRDRSLNAYAIPGGIVVVHSGLIAAADDAEELAGVLAHEVQHVELRHSLKAMAQQLGVTAAVSIAVGDLGTATKLAAHLSQLRFSRDQERAADLAGLQAMTLTGIDPQGMVAMFGKLQRDGGVTPPPFLSTHPDIAERLAAIQSAIAAAPPFTGPPLAIDWTDVRASLPP